jgi:hypothetical protein
MQSTNYVDLDKMPDAVASSLATAASNAAHLARLLKRWEFHHLTGRGNPKGDHAMNQIQTLRALRATGP